MAVGARACTSNDTRSSWRGPSWHAHGTRERTRFRIFAELQRHGPNEKFIIFEGTFGDWDWLQAGSSCNEAGLRPGRLAKDPRQSWVFGGKCSSKSWRKLCAFGCFLAGPLESRSPWSCFFAKEYSTVEQSPTAKDSLSAAVGFHGFSYDEAFILLQSLCCSILFCIWTDARNRWRSCSLNSDSILELPTYSVGEQATRRGHLQEGGASCHVGDDASDVGSDQEGDINADFFLTIKLQFEAIDIKMSSLSKTSTTAHSDSELLFSSLYLTLASLVQPSPLYFASHTFNNLPPHIRSINTLPEIKSTAAHTFILMPMLQTSKLTLLTHHQD